MESLEKSWPQNSSSVSYTTRSSTTWSATRCTPGHEAKCKCSRDSPPRDEPEEEVCDSGKWSETASLAMEPQPCYATDYWKNLTSTQPSSARLAAPSPIMTSRRTSTSVDWTETRRTSHQSQYPTRSSY